jgi:hypothetical protein
MYDFVPTGTLAIFTAPITVLVGDDDDANANGDGGTRSR